MARRVIMTKFTELQEKILLANQEELKHTLGYTNDDAFNKTIEHITKANSLAELLYNGHFDWLYSSRQLVEKLAELKDIDLKDEIKEADAYNAEVEMHCDSEMYLRAETNFVRTTESIFKLGLASQAKVVKIPNREEFYFKSIEEKIKLIGNLIREAYSKAPILPVFGAVTAYRWRFNKNSYLFNISGENVGQVA